MSKNSVQQKSIKKQPTLLSQKVKWLRIQGGFSQADAAAEMGVSRETFNRWERGSRIIPPAKLQRLRHIVHASWADFVPELVYDADGYPAGFSAKAKDALYDELAYSDLSEKEKDAALDAWDEKLIALEKEEYPAREEQRTRIAETRLCERMLSPAAPLTVRAAAVEKAMRDWRITNAAFLEGVAARFR